MDKKNATKTCFKPLFPPMHSPSWRAQSASPVVRVCDRPVSFAPTFSFLEHTSSKLLHAEAANAGVERLVE